MSNPKFPPMPSYIGPSDGVTVSKLMPGEVVIGTFSNTPLVDWKDRAEKAPLNFSTEAAQIRLLNVLAGWRDFAINAPEPALREADEAMAFYDEVSRRTGPSDEEVLAWTKRLTNLILGV